MFYNDSPYIFPVALEINNSKIPSIFGFAFLIVFEAYTGKVGDYEILW